MPIKERTTPSTTYVQVTYRDVNEYYETVPGQLDRIEYPSGPKYSNGRCNWKPCTHIWTNVQAGVFGSCSFLDDRNGAEGTVTTRHPMSVSPPSGEWDQGIVADLINQVDLNCTDSVLLYSGILQAVPLLGGALKFNAIMRKLAKQLKKDFQRKPFTTVIKSAISLDFIDRFVVSPTIDDARKFLDATNYVIRVINTARERSSHPTALQASRVQQIDSQTSDISFALPYTRWSGRRKTDKTITSKGFMLLDVRYDAGAIDPIKLWASRVGITKPFESAWDLVPFSFVVDYFTRAGDFISKLSEEMSRQEGLSGTISGILDCWGSVKREGRIIETCTGINGHPNYFFRVRNRQYGETSVSSGFYSRFPIASIGNLINSLESSNNLFDVKLSKTRIRTLLELWLQAKL